MFHSSFLPPPPPTATAVALLRAARPLGPGGHATGRCPGCQRGDASRAVPANPPASCVGAGAPGFGVRVRGCGRGCSGNWVEEDRLVALVGLVVAVLLVLLLLLLLSWCCSCSCSCSCSCFCSCCSCSCCCSCCCFSAFAAFALVYIASVEVAIVVVVVMVVGGGRVRDGLGWGAWSRG
jgi:hypothetical protein